MEFVTFGRSTVVGAAILVAISTRRGRRWAALLRVAPPAIRRPVDRRRRS